jgi:hypothetical protein
MQLLFPDSADCLRYERHGRFQQWNLNNGLGVFVNEAPTERVRLS